MSTKTLSIATCGWFLCLGCSVEPQSEEHVAQALAAEQAAMEQTKRAATTPEPPAPDRSEFNPRLLRRFRPLREHFADDSKPLNEALVTLGRMLYYDKRLSKNHDVSCNTCHQLTRYGVDGQPTSLGHRAQRGARNSPTVYNAAGYFALFWDGRAETVEEQAKEPITNPVEMALPTTAQAETTIRSIPDYLPLFRAAFPNEPHPITFHNIATAIGAFERGLATPSRWDEYLRGNKSALTPEEVEGLRVFTNVGCMVCHTGEFLGGSMFEKAGAVEPWPNQTDKGRFAITKHNADAMMFKVPTLRNVAKTAPYFHDGSVAKLPEAVRVMGTHQLGIELTDEEVRSIVTWLEALTGEIPNEYIKRPSLPPSSPATPKPNPV